MNYIPRYIEEQVLNIHRTFKVLYVGGPRQVGKTTMLRHLAARFGVSYVNLDNLESRRLAKEDTELFLNRYKTPLLIDEVQYAPELFSAIKLRVDEGDERGRYWLTGSQQWNMMKNLKESLAGRVGIVNLLGLSLAEIERRPKNDNPFSPSQDYQGKTNLKEDVLFERIARGSYPALYQLNAPDVETFFDSYLQTYLDRDVSEIFDVSKISNFSKFLSLCAARTGQMLNMSDLARDADVSVHAVQEWLGILEANMLIYLLRPYYSNVSKRLIKAPKLYFLDTGLAAFLTKWQNPLVLRNGAAVGAFFETFAIVEVIKSYLFRGKIPPLYYLRDKEGHEIDLLIDEGQTIYPVEIKLRASVGLKDIENINYWREKLPIIGKGAVLSLTPSAYPIDRATDALPIQMVS